jgi:hypothetical protein
MKIIKCKCDICREIIERANDENSLKLNMASYDICQQCFTELCELLNTILGQNKKFSMIEFFDKLKNHVS